MRIKMQAMTLAAVTTAILLLLMSGCRVANQPANDQNDQKDQPMSEYGLTLNQQAALVRAAADNGMTIWLDRIPQEKLEDYSLKAHGLALQVSEFVNNGEMATLTRDELRGQLLSLVPDDYTIIIDQALHAISPLHVDVSGEIGKDNVRRLRAALHGIITAIEEHSPEDGAEGDSADSSCTGTVCPVM